jgi:N-acetylglucosaminyldiphosphoundecaprenol N-acetyl-beta-D-mannosaminyltransferase
MQLMLETRTITPVWVWGLPLAPFDFGQAIAEVHRLIGEGRPSFLITANLHYAMLTSRDPRLARVNEAAAFLVADGMPLVWASRWRTSTLPERVTGSDLIPALCGEAARAGYRVFLLGGGPGIGDEAARRLRERHPDLQIVGIESPPFRELTAEEDEQLCARIRAASPDLLIMAFALPKGELWIAEHCERLGVPVTVQGGASLDFIAGRVRRSPRWLQRIGFEWLYRLYLEPGRLFRRYAANAWFALRMLARDLVTPCQQRC